MNKHFNKEFHDRFTKLKDTINYIEELENLDLSKIEYKELENLIDERFPYIPYPSATIPAGTEVFRARLNEYKDPFTKVEDIFIPPANKIVEYGRSNKPNEQVFYCASNFKIATIEVIQDYQNNPFAQKDMAFLTIGIWKTKFDLHVGDITHSPLLRKLRKDISASYDQMEKILNSQHHNKDFAESGSLILQFFADQYTKRDITSQHEYKISALYSSRLKQGNNYVPPRYAKDKFDGINYPSVAMSYKGDNQALFYETAKEKLELVNTIFVMCGNINIANSSFTPAILHEAKNIVDGIIEWDDKPYKINK